jgi:hypothetical protein
VFDVLKFGLIPLDAGRMQAAFSFAIEREPQGEVRAHAAGRGRIDFRRLAAWVWQQLWDDQGKQ